MQYMKKLTSFILILALLFPLFPVSNMVYAEDIVKKMDSSTAFYFKQIAYGNGVYVAVGTSGKIVTSTDGVTWTARNSGVTVSLNTVTWGNNIFVAGGASGKILTSPDGIIWTSRSTGIAGTDTVTNIGFVNNQFMALTLSGNYYTSSNGTSWGTGTSLGIELYGVTYGNSYYVITGETGNIRTKTGAGAWASKTSGITTYNLTNVLYGNNLFVAVGDNGSITTSPTSVTWTSQTSGTINNLSAIAYGNGKFVAVGNNSTMLVSTNGTTWNNKNISISGYGFSSINFLNGKFFALGGNGLIITSTDTETWTIMNLSAKFSAIANNGSKYVSVGYNGLIVSSTDGSTWNAEYSGVSSDLYDVIWGNGKFVAVGNNSTILSSLDGTNWTIVSQNLTKGGKPYNGVAYKNGQYILLGNLGAISISTNAINWTYVNEEPYTDLYNATYGNGKFVAVGTNGYLITSTDGVTWSNISQSGIFNDISFGNGKFVAVGDQCGVYTSINGINWTYTSIDLFGDASPYILYSIDFNGNMFIMTGDYGLIATSTDGVTWTLIGTTYTNNLLEASCMNNEYIIVGEGVILSMATTSSIPTSIVQTDITMEGLSSETISPILLDQNGVVLEGYTFNYSVANTNVATVSASGIITSKSCNTLPNTTTLTVSVADYPAVTKTINILVNTPTSIKQSDVFLNELTSLQLTPTVLNQLGNSLTGYTFTYSIADTNIATVDAFGLVAAQDSTDGVHNTTLTITAIEKPALTKVINVTVTSSMSGGMGSIFPSAEAQSQLSGIGLKINVFKYQNGSFDIEETMKLFENMLETQCNSDENKMLISIRNFNNIMSINNSDFVLSGTYQQSIN